MSAEHGPEIESEEQDRVEADSGARRSRRGRRRRHGMVWEFFHPQEAMWSAPGEHRVRSGAERLRLRMDRSVGLRVAIAVVAVVVVLVLVLSGWAWTRVGDGPGEGGPESSSSGSAESEDRASALPGEAEAGVGGSGAGAREEEESASGREADKAALEEINDGEGLITARDEDADDPLVTGARFLRSLRSVDTASDEVGQWYTARDSFLAEGQAGRQEDWGGAGEQAAVSSAEVSWAEMDAAIVDGRGIAPEFEFGPEVEPGTHLVQVGMRLDREISVDGDTVQEPSGALMEAVVVCPPAEGVDRCVVTRWAETPAGFTASMDEAWRAYQ